MRECHDGLLVGHGGAKRTTTFFKKSYYWPNLKDDVEEYVKTCLTCQQNQTLNKKQVGLLQPYQFLKGHGKVCPWISWLACHHQGVLMPSWWWWIDLTRWHISFPPRIVPWPKKREGCSSHMCLSIMTSQGHSFESRPKIHEQVLVNPMEAHAVGAQDEHILSTPNKWTNREGELGHPTIPKELCGSGSTILGGPFGVGRILLQQFGAFGNGGHPFSHGDGQVTNRAHNLGRATPK